MSFATPGYLALLALTPIAAAAYVWLAAWRRRASERFAPGQTMGRLSGGVSSRMRGLKAALALVALAAIPIALARPQIGHDEVIVEQAGADIVIALDLSRSMLADDVAPNRLDAAQRAAVSLLARLQGHRTGLVFFAHSALVRSPLTTDLTPLQVLTQSAHQEVDLLDPGSDLGGAIRTAIASLAAGEAESQAIVIISDGEDHETDALQAAREAAQDGIRIFTVGVGTQDGGEIPAVRAAAQPDEETLDEDATLEDPPTIVTTLDEELLRRIAAATPGGAYVTSSEIAGVADAIDRFDRTSFVSERKRLPVERFQWFVLAALVALALEMLLPERRVSWRAIRLPRLAPPPAAQIGQFSVLIVVAGLMATACGVAGSEIVAQGNRAYEEERYEDALESYRRAGAVAPDRTEPHVNAGLALHQLERFSEAVTETARALPADDAQLAARIHYTLGNHYVRLNRPFDALAAYRDALLLDPDHANAKHNLELVLLLIVDANLTGDADEIDPGERPSDTDDPPSNGGGENGDGDGGTNGAPGGVTLRSLGEALAGIDEQFTLEEALQTLDLIREFNRQQPAAGGGGSPSPSSRPDY